MADLVPRSKKLLVIGTGPVGLGTASVLKEAAIPYDQVDAGHDIGGNWRHGVYVTAHIVSSKASTAFAGYPMPADYPDFPSAAQMLAYLETFARNKGLNGAIELDKRVVYARPNHDESWQVWFAGGEQRHYKGVVVCNGHHWDKRYPKLPGNFTGTLMHSKDYKQPSDLVGKRVLVIGGGNSGCDLASEAARVARSCDISLRSGYWFLPKVLFGRPLADLPMGYLPTWAQRLFLRAMIRIIIGKYSDYGLAQPDHRMFERHPTYGTEMLGYIRQGRITPRPGIANCEGETVTFVDGSKGEYDLIVAATGFHNRVTFLPDGLVPTENNAMHVFGGAFPARVKNLYIIGAFQPRNGFGSLLIPAMELHARIIKMQDELFHPVGYILRWSGDDTPVDQLVDHYKKLREIKRSHYLLPVLRWYDWWLSKKHPREVLPPEMYRDPEPAQATPPALAAADRR